ncbi:MAG: hypothetical protein LBT90_04145 [Holosporaceae bacterium]|nr:hypothetical protein [Holosporaceae bacterium]
MSGNNSSSSSNDGEVPSQGDVHKDYREIDLRSMSPISSFFILAPR